MADRYGKRVNKDADISKEDREKLEIVLELRSLIKKDKPKKFMKFYRKAKKKDADFSVKKDNGYRTERYDSSLHMIGRGRSRTGYFDEWVPIYLYNEIFQNNAKNIVKALIKEKELSRDELLTKAIYLENKDIFLLLLDLGVKLYNENSEEIDFKNLLEEVYKKEKIFAGKGNENKEKYWLKRQFVKDVLREAHRREKNMTGKGVGNELNYLIENDFIKNIHELLQSRIDINSRDKNGTSPLLLAYEKGNMDVFKRLLDKGADTNVQDSHRITLLYKMTEAGQNKWVKKLVEHGADIDFRNEEYKGKDVPYRGENALYLACKVKNKELITFFLEHGADVNIQTRGDKSTPLHLAYKYKDEALVKKLLEYGADTKIKDYYGKPPFNQKTLTKKEIERYLKSDQIYKENGAETNEKSVKVVNKNAERFLTDKKDLQKLKIERIKDKFYNGQTKLDYLLAMRSLKKEITYQLGKVENGR